MGVFTKFGDRIRGYMRNDKESTALELAKAATQSSNALGSGFGFDMMQLYGPDYLSNYLRIEQDLMTRYQEFANMNEYPEINAALNVFADDSTVPNTQLNRVIWASAQDRTLELTLDDLLHRRLGMDGDMWGIARTLCTYGNSYAELLVTDAGVESYVQLLPHEMRRVEGPRGELFGFIQDRRGRVGFTIQDYQSMMAQRLSGASTPNTASYNSYGNRAIPFEDWEIVHWRLRSSNPRAIYGGSVMDGARWIYKRLNLLEDAALIYKLQRAPQRYAFYVDVGNNPPAEALQLVNRVRQQYRKNRFINPSTNQLDLRFDAITPIDDIFIPIREGVAGSKVEVLNSPQWNSTEDIAYFLNKLVAAMGIPRAYLSYDKGVGKNNAAQADVRFGRSVLRIQQELRYGVGKICRVHLSALNIDPNQQDFDIRMEPPSAIFTLAQLEVMSARADIAAKMKENVSHHWLLSKIFSLSDDDIKLIVSEQDEDRDRDIEFQARTQKEIMKGQMKGQMEVQTAFAPPQPPIMQAAPAAAPKPRPAAQHSSLFRAGGFRLNENELMKGSRESERRMEDKLGQLMENDSELSRKLTDLGGLLRDLANSTRRVS